MCSKAADKQAKKSKFYKKSLSLPLHVTFANGAFRFRYVFPPILRDILKKREYKVNLGTNIELAYIHAYKLNSIVNMIRWELRAVQDNEAKNKNLNEVLQKLFSQGQSSPFGNGTMLSNYMTMQSTNSLLDSVLTNIALLNVEAAPEDKVKLRIRERLKEATAQLNQPEEKNSKSLSQVYEEWREEKRVKNIKQSTEKVLQTVLKELLWFFGDVDVFSITHDRMKEYYDFWRGNVPPLMKRAPKNKPQLSYKEMQEKIKAGEINDFISDTHKQNMLVYIRDFLEWGASPVRQTQYFDKQYKDYMDAIETHRKRRGNKRSLTDDEIIEIRGYLQKFKGSEKANSSYGDIRWRYWIFHILLLTGARPAEICQLRVNDILHTGAYNTLADVGTGETLAMPCFLISECEVDEQGKKGYDGYKNLPPKSVKNDGSERLVPIHPWLISDGFFDYVESRRQKGEQQLFDVKYQQANAYASIVTKYYGRVIDTLFEDKKERNIKLYSTRNNFEEKILRLGKDNYDTFISQRLTGRIPQEGSVEAYRDKPDVERQYAIVKQVAYKFMEEATQSNA